MNEKRTPLVFRDWDDTTRAERDAEIVKLRTTTLEIDEQKWLDIKRANKCITAVQEIIDRTEDPELRDELIASLAATVAFMIELDYKPLADRG